MAWTGVLGISVATVLIVTLAAFAIEPFPTAEAQAEPLLGQVSIFAGNFAPRGWALCDGQLLQISQNSALFSLIGTFYGGDGRTTFALPDMRERVWVHWGNGPGITDVTINSPGVRGGTGTATIGINNMPSHTHTATLHAAEVVGDTASADGSALALSFARLYSTTLTTTDDVSMHSSSITVDSTGGGQPISVRDPYVSMTCIIALQGIFPSRN